MLGLIALYFRHYTLFSEYRSRDAVPQMKGFVSVVYLGLVIIKGAVLN